MAPHLQPEILLAIFHILVREAQSNSILLPSLTVCQFWSRAAQSILWKHIVLTTSTLPKFLAHFPEDGELHHTIRSLTLRISPDEGPLGDKLDRLAALISRSVRDLTSFSLTLSQTLQRPQQDSDFWLARASVVSLLRALPPSCVDVEVDTNSWELARNDSFDSQHICPVIRSILPRLRHLHLRLGSVCDEIIATVSADGKRLNASAPELLSLCVSLHPRGKLRGVISGAFECPYVRDWISDLAPGSTMTLAGEGQDSWPVPRLAGSLVSAVERGSFPKLQQCDVSQFQSNQYRGHDDEFPDDAWEISHPFYTELVVVRDCLHNSTFPLPIKMFAMNPRPEKSVIYDREDVCFIGTWWDVFNRAEDAPWVEAITGARWPRGTAASLPLRRPELMSRQEYEALEGAKYGPEGAKWHLDMKEGQSKRQRVFRIEGVGTVVTKDEIPVEEPI